MESRLLKHEEIAAWSGYPANQVARIRAWCDEAGISYHLGRGGRICTTQAAVDSTLTPRGRKMGARDVELEFQ